MSKRGRHAVCRFRGKSNNKSSFDIQNGDAKMHINSLDFIHFVRVCFDVQMEAHGLMSRMKLINKATRSRRWNALSVRSILTFKVCQLSSSFREIQAYNSIYTSLKHSFDHLHSFTEQLFTYARPISPFMTLPYIGTSTEKLIFSHPPYSPRTVLVKDCIQVLNQVDILWNSVGIQLRSFGENLNDPTVLSS